MFQTATQSSEEMWGLELFDKCLLLVLKNACANTDFYSHSREACLNISTLHRGILRCVETIHIIVHLLG